MLKVTSNETIDALNALLKAYTQHPASAVHNNGNPNGLNREHLHPHESSAGVEFSLNHDSNNRVHASLNNDLTCAEVVDTLNDMIDDSLEDGSFQYCEYTTATTTVTTTATTRAGKFECVESDENNPQARQYVALSSQQLCEQQVSLLEDFVSTCTEEEIVLSCYEYLDTYYISVGCQSESATVTAINFMLEAYLGHPWYQDHKSYVGNEEHLHEHGGKGLVFCSSAAPFLSVDAAVCASTVDGLNDAMSEFALGIFDCVWRETPSFTTSSSTLIITTTTTTAPTDIPTDTPTESPTTTPTWMPTEHPSHVPTFEPTLLPTVSPTAFPTAVPSAPPTMSPTATPTMQPSCMPTSLPSNTPSNVPTGFPTNFPTISPASATSTTSTTTATIARCNGDPDPPICLILSQKCAAEVDVQILCPASCDMSCPNVTIASVPTHVLKAQGRGVVIGPIDVVFHTVYEKVSVILTLSNDEEPGQKYKVGQFIAGQELSGSDDLPGSGTESFYVRIGSWAPAPGNYSITAVLSGSSSWHDRFARSRPSIIRMIAENVFLSVTSPLIFKLPGGQPLLPISISYSTSREHVNIIVSISNLEHPGGFKVGQFLQGTSVGVQNMDGSAEDLHIDVLLGSWAPVSGSYVVQVHVSTGGWHDKVASSTPAIFGIVSQPTETGVEVEVLSPSLELQKHVGHSGKITLLVAYSTPFPSVSMFTVVRNNAHPGRKYVTDRYVTETGVPLVGLPGTHVGMNVTVVLGSWATTGLYSVSIVLSTGTWDNRIGASSQTPLTITTHDGN